MADDTKTDRTAEHETHCGHCRTLAQQGKPFKPTEQDPICRVCKTPKHFHTNGVLCK